jgi:hypothetical protein
MRAFMTAVARFLFVFDMVDKPIIRGAAEFTIIDL